ncbi:hypothetical protein NQZ68_012394 [Dissostichus eleginoides]|nr:hypothetical protein NQZ68_012394 [Dissostichus eleginoides]
MHESTADSDSVSGLNEWITPHSAKQQTVSDSSWFSDSDVTSILARRAVAAGHSTGPARCSCRPGALWLPARRAVAAGHSTGQARCGCRPLYRPGALWLPATLPARRAVAASPTRCEGQGSHTQRLS